VQPLVRAVFRSPILVGWALFLVLHPFYVFPSGTPQPSDLIGLSVAVAAIAVRRYALTPSHMAAVKALGTFTAWVTIVNVTWAGILLGTDSIQRIGTLVFPLFYLFNLVIVWGAFAIYGRYRSLFLIVTAYSTLLSVAIQTAAALLTSTSHYRVQLFFNNPNQLGYFALLAATILVIAGRSARMPSALTAAGVAGSALLAAFSLSKAAMLGVVFMMVVAFLRRPGVVGVAAIVMGLGMAVVDSSTLLERIDDRFASSSGDDDTLESRGYDRIVNFPEYLLFGAGEGHTERFGTRFKGEIHSSVGTLLFGYGIVGFSLFSIFVFRAVRRVPLEYVAMFLPVLFYGLTHQGLRSRFFWVALALLPLLRDAMSGSQRGGQRAARGRFASPAASARAR
jgi:hypothetical protein